MKTDLCHKLGIEHPILQAAIGGISCPELAAAVSNAGGLGAIAMTGWGYDGTKARLQRTAELTNRGLVANLLLSYDISAELDAILEILVDRDGSIADCEAAGFEADVARRVEHLIYISEYKRFQSAPGTRLTKRAFWLDRRYPIVNRWRDRS